MNRMFNLESAVFTVTCFEVNFAAGVSSFSLF